MNIRAFWAALMTRFHTEVEPGEPPDWPAIRSALQALPVPARTRDYRLTEWPRPVFSGPAWRWSSVLVPVGALVLVLAVFSANGPFGAGSAGSLLSVPQLAPERGATNAGLDLLAPAGGTMNGPLSVPAPVALPAVPSSSAPSFAALPAISAPSGTPPSATSSAAAPRGLLAMPARSPSPSSSPSPSPSPSPSFLFRTCTRIWWPWYWCSR